MQNLFNVTKTINDSPYLFTWTATQNGYVMAELCTYYGSSTARLNLFINGKNVEHDLIATSGMTRCHTSAFFPVKKGDVVILNPTSVGYATYHGLFFIPYVK